MESLLIGTIIIHSAVAVQEVSKVLESYDSGVRTVVLGNYNAAIFQATAALLLFNACTGELPSMACFVGALVLFSRSVVLGARAIGDTDPRRTSTHAVQQFLVSVFMLRVVFMAFYSADRRAELRQIVNCLRPHLAAFVGLLLIFGNMFIRASFVSGVPDHRKRGWRWTMVALSILSAALLVLAGVALWSTSRAVAYFLFAVAATALQAGMYELQRIDALRVPRNARSFTNIGVATTGAVCAALAFIRWSQTDAAAARTRRYELPIPVAARFSGDTLRIVGKEITNVLPI